MKKLFFVLMFLSGSSFADYNGSLFDPKYGELLYIRVYQPVNQICVQINSMNHICWNTAPIVNSFLLLEDNSFFLLEDGTQLILQP